MSGPTTRSNTGGASSPAPGSSSEGSSGNAAALANAAAQQAELIEVRRQLAIVTQQLAAQQQQQQQQQQQLGSGQQSVSSNDLLAIVQLLQQSQAQQAVQLNELQQIGSIPTYNGKGVDTTLSATEWLHSIEEHFTARERALKITAAAGDSARVTGAAKALEDDARRWYNSLQSKPSTWAEFIAAVKARFCSVPDARIRVKKLRDYVEKMTRIKEKMTVQGMQVYTAQFQQLAGEVTDEYLTLHGKLELLAQGLPSRSAEVVLKEDSKSPTPPLSEVINSVLARATQKEQAASYGASGASSSVASAAPLHLDAISLAATMFGVSRDEARRYVDDSNAEGWAAYDTDSSPSHIHAGQSHSNARGNAPTLSNEQMIQLAAMFSNNRSFKDLSSKKASAAAGPASNRNVPSGVRDDIPEELRKARMDAGLCIKCGVHAYEPGGRGHNSRTCKSVADKTTNVSDGKKKAGLFQ